MAIDINKPGVNWIAPPNITIVGNKIEEGVITPLRKEGFNKPLVEDHGNSYVRREEVLYDEAVTVTLIPDSNFRERDYAKYVTVAPYEDHARFASIVVGAGEAGSHKKVNELSDTYYTLNGKDPVMTKSNLYTKPFVIRRNTSGTDNVILKARTYAKGYKSEVMTVELRIFKSKGARSV